MYVQFRELLVVGNKDPRYQGKVSYLGEGYKPTMLP